MSERNSASKQWLSLMAAESKFRKSVGLYNKNVDLEQQKKDVIWSLKERDGGLITTRLMSEGYIKTELIEGVWNELVWVVFNGVDSAASWAIDALGRIPPDKKMLYRNAICTLVFDLAEKSKEDYEAMKFGSNLLYDLGYEDEMKLYDEKYKTILDS